MSITLKKLCTDTEMKYNLKLIAGKEGMENSVRWVHMVEDRQVPDFLHGGELVFTTGIGHISRESLPEFVKRLKQHNAAGVVINIGPYLSELPESVIDYCNRESFPLFTLPWNVYITDITYDFCRRIIENEKLETTAAEAFKNMLLNPKQSEKYFPFLEQQGFGRATDYRVLSVKFFKNGKNVTEQFERNNHIKLWNILAKSKFYPSAMFTARNRLIVIRQDIDDKTAVNLNDILSVIAEQKEITYFMGISTPGKGYKSVPRLLKEADAAYRTAKSDSSSCAFYRDIGINKIILGVSDKEILKSFAAEQLQEISDYDRMYKTDYYDVLHQYLLCDSSVMAVADKYGLHRNTVNSKMKAIKSIFNLELTAEKKAELLLAFKIKAILTKQTEEIKNE
jgi:DNA-binding PucR family transcriptional regulator